MRKPRLRHPGLSLVRRGAGSAAPRVALRPSRPSEEIASGAPPAPDLGVKPGCKVDSPYEA